jgi:hypothetical protein
MSRIWLRKKLPWLAPAAAVTVAVSFIAMGAAHAFLFSKPPKDLDLSRSKATEHGVYLSTIAPDVTPVAVRRMHSWTIAVTTPDGKPVEQARVTINGGMPQHGHGLPTKPVVTPQAGGRYQVEGVKFNMGGWWTLTVKIDGAAGSDAVTYNLSL